MSFLEKNLKISSSFISTDFGSVQKAFIIGYSYILSCHQTKYFEIMVIEEFLNKLIIQN